MIKRIKKIRKLFGFAMLAGTAIVFVSSSKYEVLKLALNYWNPVSLTEYRLKNLSTDEFIEKIQSAITEKNLSEASEIIDIATEHGHQIPEELLEQTKEGYFDTSVRWSTDFANGFIYGDMNSVQGITGTILSDFVLIGDLRDLGNEGTKYLNGDNYDGITLGMSAVGATMSVIALGSAASSYVTGGLTLGVSGTATALDNSISVIKTAHKFGKLSNKLTANISKITTDAVDVKKLRQSLGSLSSVVKMPSSAAIISAAGKVNLKDIVNGRTDDITKVFIEITPVDLKAASKLTDGLVSPKAFAEIAELANSNLRVINAGGFRTSFKALELADNTRDMTKIAELSGKYGNKTASVLTVLGKKAYKLGKLLYLICAIIIGIIGWLLYAIWFAFSTAKGTVRLISSAGEKT